MKKIFLIAAFAGIVFASCKKEAPVASVQNEGQQEITFSALSKAMTKGVLGSGNSFGTTAANRTINVAGATKTDGKVVDFLEAKTFRYLTDGWKGAKYESSTWSADPVYYPIGGTNNDYHFLAYSESNGFESTARWYGSTEVEIQVGDESAQNDIVYSSFVGNKGSAAPATFNHTQALVTVKIQASSGQRIEINKIGFKDVKTSGVLNIKLDKTKIGSATPDATPKWIFNAGCNCACAEMGNYYLDGCYTSTGATDAEKWAIPSDKESTFTNYTPGSDDNGYGVITDAGCVFDRLFPEQTIEANTMIINYTLGGLKAEVELPLDGTAAGHAEAKTWSAKKRYVYTITVNPAEILINPSVETGAWTVETTSGIYN